MAAPNLVNAEHLTKSYGTRILIDDISLGLGAGEVVGVVGRNGDGKSTLLGMLTGIVEPDSGRVTRTGGVSLGALPQVEHLMAGQTVRDVALASVPDHVWNSDARNRAVVTHFLAGIDLDTPMAELSGGERRRVGLVGLLTAHHDLLVLDEPTNHLDVMAVDWLAKHLVELQNRGTAMLIVSHDRWFLDAVCTTIWEVHDASVDAYEGGYAAYVLARAERARQTAANEARRQNLVRKELAWLRRGAPARTSKPKFRIEAANELIAGVPEPRDMFQLAQFSSARLGKDVIDLKNVSMTLGAQQILLDDLTWSIGPGERIGLIGVNGAGKSTLLRLLSGELAPTSGNVKHGKTLRLAHLSQHVDELDDSEQVLASVNRLREETRLATGREASAANLLEEFGFRGDKLVTRIGDLSGGERRRLQLLRLLITEPNVLLLDEPTNDLDIDTLTVLEDYLDTWPGTLIVASHDRYFLERVCDVQYALRGDGSCVLLPGGVDQYLTERAAALATVRGPSGTASTGISDSARLRAAKKQVAKLESQLSKVTRKIEQIHAEMAEKSSDYTALAALQSDLSALEAEQDRLEEAWLESAEAAEG